MSDQDIHIPSLSGDDPDGGTATLVHPGTITVMHIDERREEERQARNLPRDTKFKKVDGKYRPVIRIEVHGSKGNRRLDFFDAAGNLLASSS